MDPEPASSIIPPQTGQTYTKPANAQQYIRTYAKDVAQLKGKPLTSTSSLSPKENHDVVLPDVDVSPVQQLQPVSSAIQKESRPETIELTSEDSSGLFQKEAALAEQPAPVFSPIITTDKKNIAESESSAREEVLVRLRAKIGHSSTESSVLQRPLAKPPQSESSFFFGRKKETVESTVAPAPLEVLPKKVLQNPSPLHTYSSDFSDRIDQRKATTFSVLAAQQDAGSRNPTYKELSTPKKNILLPLFLGIIFIFVGGLGIYGALTFVNSSDTTLPTLTVPSLIVPDETVEITGETGLELLEALSSVSKQQLVAENIIVTYITEASTTSQGIEKSPLPGGALIKELPLQAPDLFLRNIDPQSTVGVINSAGTNHPFFIFRVTSYERTFAGMLAWEPVLSTSLGVLYPDTIPLGNTSSSSALTQLSKNFFDSVVSNQDVRILLDSNGNERIVYGYIAKDTLVITGNSSSFTRLVERLSVSKAQ